MKLHTLVIACLLSALPSAMVQARDGSEHLIQSCKELVGVYAKREEMRLAAGLTTSLSEALRAGYCMGVVEEYRRHYECDTDDWHRQAQAIAELPLSFAKRTSVEELLEISCDF